MTLRDGMAPLVARVRLLVQDNGTTQLFTDDDIQDTLDDNSFDTTTLPDGVTVSGYPTDGVGNIYDFNGAAADLWEIKAGDVRLWKGQFPQYAQEMIKRFRAKSWPQSKQSTRVYPDQWVIGDPFSGSPR